MGLASIFTQGAATILKVGGSQGTLIKTITGPFNPVTGAAEKITQSYPIMVSNPSHVERWENGSLIRQGEDSTTIGAKGLPVVPEMGDRVAIGQATWIITTVKEIQAQNTTIVYDVTVKK